MFVFKIISSLLAYNLFASTAVDTGRLPLLRLFRSMRSDIVLKLNRWLFCILTNGGNTYKNDNSSTCLTNYLLLVNFRVQDITVLLFDVVLWILHDKKSNSKKSL